MMLVLKEAGEGVFLQLLRVGGNWPVDLLHVPSRTELATVWHVDLERRKGKEKKRMRNEEDGREKQEGWSEGWGPHLTLLWCQADLLIVP